MITINIQLQEYHSSPIEICCENDDIHKILCFLERSPNVRAYSLATGAGRYTEAALRYNFPGYLKPAGKAVEKFDWTEWKS